MLSREQLEDLRNCDNKNCFDCSMTIPCQGTIHTVLADNALELMDQVEAQQKEIEKLTSEIIGGNDNWDNLTSQYDCAKIEVKYLKQQVEQLEKFKQDSLGLIQRHEKLKERHAAYRETLKQAREALKCTPYYTPNIEEALEAIDKAIGGGQ